MDVLLVMGLENPGARSEFGKTAAPSSCSCTPARRLGSSGDSSVLTVDNFFGFGFVQGRGRADAATMCCRARLVVSGLCMQPRVCMDVCLCLAVSGMPAQGRAADGSGGLWRWLVGYGKGGPGKEGGSQSIPVI